jgi:hypothetical protein
MSDQKNSPAGQDQGQPSNKKQNKPQHPRFEANRHFQIFRLSNLTNLPPVEWLVKGVIPKAAMVVLYCPPSSPEQLIQFDWLGSIFTRLRAM